MAMHACYSKHTITGTNNKMNMFIKFDFQWFRGSVEEDLCVDRQMTDAKKTFFYQESNIFVFTHEWNVPI